MHGERNHRRGPNGRANEAPPLLFCPYCRDGFEDAAECPEHELTLVPIDRLPRIARSASQVTFFADPRLGRGPILLGGLLVLVGFFLPFVRTDALQASGLGVAIDGAHNLWLVPGAALAILAVLWVRRDRVAMHSARFAVLGLGLAGVLPLAYTARRVALMAEVTQRDVDWLVGGLTMLVGLVLACVGSLRLGVRRYSGRD